KTRGGFYPGVLSQYTVLSEEWYSHAPDTLDAAQASTLPCAGLTAWFALIERGDLQTEERHPSGALHQNLVAGLQTA
ncbi:hypothetical protein ACC697_39960, partial [Rhizobium ruizarguesonis]